MHLRVVRVANELGVTKIPAPEKVEVVECDGAVYLLRLNSLDECLADTWHESVEAAKAQANFEFGIEDGDWKNAD
jgi:hypothetical protein